MYKFFVEEEQIDDKIIKIIGQDVNHIKNVLRLEIGENICVCNKKTSSSFICKILEFNNNEVKCNVL